MENPIKMDDLGRFSHIFGSTPICSKTHGVAEVSTTGDDQPPWHNGAFGPECQGDATRVQ